MVYKYFGKKALPRIKKTTFSHLQGSIPESVLQKRQGCRSRPFLTFPAAAPTPTPTLKHVIFT